MDDDDVIVNRRTPSNFLFDDFNLTPASIEPYIGGLDDIQVPLSTFKNFIDLYSTDELRQIAADYAATTGNPNDAYVVLDALGIPSDAEMRGLIDQAIADTAPGGIM
jgi:hypothetical protein